MWQSIKTMQTKFSADEILQNAFVGKKFIGSQFRKSDEFLFDINDDETDVKVADITGKTIKEVEIVAYGYRDSGISLKFEEFNYYFFFFSNDTITVDA